jgi:hypothetical protein
VTTRRAGLCRSCRRGVLIMCCRREVKSEDARCRSFTRLRCTMEHGTCIEVFNTCGRVQVLGSRTVHRSSVLFLILPYTKISRVSSLSSEHCTVAL